METQRIDFEQYRRENGTIDLAEMIFSETVFGYVDPDEQQGPREVSSTLGTIDLVEASVGVKSRQVAVLVGAFSAIAGALATRIEQLEDQVDQLRFDATLKDLGINLREGEAPPGEVRVVEIHLPRQE